MTSGEPRRALGVALLLAAACGGGSGPASHAPPAVDGALPPGANVVPISVNGPGCIAGAYLNEPCVSATVCVPGTSTCQRIDGLLLDTGSTGLRVFSQALRVSLPPVAAAGGGALAECIGYLDGSAQWGPVVRADVVLGGEPAVTVPIQVVQAGFASPPSACAGAQADPASAGFNGILGVAVFEQDCGQACERSTSNGMYYACSGSSCVGAQAALASQVANPVAALPTDGNGVIVHLPAVPPGGAPSVSGALVLGIGTRANNAPPAGTTALPLDASGELRTAIAGGTLPSFLDTGSNAIFFPSAPSSALTLCGAPNGGWFCPASPVSLDATNTGAGGTPAVPAPFTVVSVEALAASANVASVGGLSPGPSGVDWGLPFHFGRDVYVGVEGRSSGLGTGPYVAY